MMGIAAKFAPKSLPASRLIDEFRENESGATAIEYGLIVSLIFLAIVGAVKSFGTTTNEMYNEIETTISDQID